MMKKYEAYKDSGLEWLGMVPEHWEVMRLKVCTNIVLGKMLMSIPPKGQEEEYSLEKYLKSKNVGWLHLNTDGDDVEEMFFNEAEKELYKLREGDIVMNEGGDIGKVALWSDTEYNCYIQNSINKITPSKNVSSSFLVYWLYSVSLSGYFWSVVSQISIAHLTKEKLGNTPVVLPPLSEQHTIASYLDHKVSQIDALIAEKEKMIEELKAYRSSVITEAVTKGLDKNVEMKESGVEWIGKTPQKWNTTKLKYYISIGSGDALSNDKINDKGKFAVYGGGERLGYCEQSNTSSEELIVGRVGARCGCVTMPRCSCWATDNALKIKTTLPLEFTYFLLIAANLNSLNNSNAQPLITATSIKNIDVSLPSIKEQKEIASFLVSKTSDIYSSISEQEHQLSDLQSYKSSLITEAVTGKIDLRDWKTKE